MTSSSTGEHDDSAWEPEPAKPAAGSGDGETYKLAGGYTGSDIVITPMPIMAPPEPRKSALRKKSRRGDFWPLMGFNLLVFVSSVCVMTLELTASRLVGKHVGSSLYTWTSVIGVVLAGITVGNYLGGYIADRVDRRKALSWMFLISSMLCAAILWIDLQIAGIPRPESLSWPMWVLTIVASLFLLPSIALGAASPLVASMAISRSSKTGITVGNVYAWGALGSIVGTFLTGFYLIDAWGTRSIIGWTSAVLAMLGVIVASGQWVFRTAVVLGWLQTLGLLVLATIGSGDLFAGVVERLAGPPAVDDDAPGEWRQFARAVGEKFHEFGLLLKLRDDSPGRYYDESQYSYLEVGDDYVNDAPVKYLRLDKLIHSYYNPEEPTALYYEYEQVYAAVTKRVAGSPGPVTAPLAQFPGSAELLAKLPAGVIWDEAAGVLRVERPSEQLFEQLSVISPDAPFWDVLNRLERETTRPSWGGFTALPLDGLPGGFTWPSDLEPELRYDELLHTITARQPVTKAIRDRLVGLTATAPWQRAIQKLRLESGRVNALFLGGGGFIFPRWVLEHFPGSEHLDVAELDPAVLKAVISQFGFTPADQERITTTIGDARNFVEDRYRQNERLLRDGHAPVLYDFIYGDAFNDFGIPWHLATKEFTERLRSLLSERGVFQANIIEIYPRTEFPGGLVETSQVVYPGILPGRFQKQNGAEFVSAELLPELTRLSTSAADGVGSTLTWRGPMSNALRDALHGLDDANVAWKDAIDDLWKQSHQRRVFEGTIPEGLLPESVPVESWMPCPGKFEGVEIWKRDDGRYVVAVRGGMTSELRDRLLHLAPADPAWLIAIDDLDRRSHRPEAGGQFLGRYTATCAALFPNLYLFSTSQQQPGNDRDTFVLVCSNQPLDLDRLEETGEWNHPPFASLETRAAGQPPAISGHMAAVLELSQDQILTDDFAPVDTLLKPVFTQQDD